MKKYFILGFLLLALLLSTAVTWAAKPDFQAAKIANPNTGQSKNTVVLPATAIEATPNIFYLGTVNYQGKEVEGYAFLHYKEGFAKSSAVCDNDGICEPGENARKCPADCGGDGSDTSSCYGFLARGAKWKVVEPYLVNPSNTSGLSKEFVLANLAENIHKWELSASANIIDSGTSTTETLIADTSYPDGQNEVYFGDIAQVGVIAINITWGIFSGPPRQRELVEWDQVYDQADFPWSASGEANKMDFENIATHELGHALGLDDLYEVKCSEATMYGYANYGETQKRTLEAGDILGIQKLY